MPSKPTTTKPSVLSTIHDGLVNNPELASRIESIIRLSNEPDENGRIRSADEVESLLIEEVRKLGSESLSHWAAGADRKLGKELKQTNPQVQMREKKLYSGGAGSA